MLKNVKIDDIYSCNIPENWDEVTLEQYYRLELWVRSGDENIVKALSHITDIPFEVWNRTKTSDFEAIIMPSISWMKENPKIRKRRMLRSITIDGKTIEIPRNIALETAGQKVACDQKMQEYALKYKDDVCRLGFYQMSYLIAAYISPKLSGEDFDMAYTDVVQQKVMKFPALEMLPLGNFFLKKFLAYALSNLEYQKSKETQKKSWRILRGWKNLVSFVRGTLSRKGTSLNTMKS